MGLQHFRTYESVRLFVEYSQKNKKRNSRTRNSIKKEIYKMELPLIRQELSAVSNFEEMAIANYITSLSALQNIYDILMNESASYKEVEKTIQYASLHDRRIFMELTNVNIEIFQDFEKVDSSK